MTGKSEAGAHSVWLMPGIEDTAMLTGIVEGLAAEFGSPVFQPHLTLVEDMPRAADELAPLIAEVAAGIRRFAVPVVAVGTSDLYFRSFYARFDAMHDLLELKMRAIAKIAYSPVKNFMPHVSLAYGVEDGPAKAEARQRVSGFLVGRPIHFSRVAVVFSGQQIPIEDWRIDSSVDLA